MFLNDSILVQVTRRALIEGYIFDPSDPQRLFFLFSPILHL
jgi:type II secretory pathway component PulC